MQKSIKEKMQYINCCSKIKYRGKIKDFFYQGITIFMLLLYYSPKILE